MGIDRKTIRKYLAPALAAGLTPGKGGTFDEALWRELIAGWFLEVGDPAARAVTWPAIAAHHDWIDAQLTASVTVAAIAQRVESDRPHSRSLPPPQRGPQRSVVAARITSTPLGASGFAESLRKCQLRCPSTFSILVR